MVVAAGRGVRVGAGGSVFVGKGAGGHKSGHAGVGVIVACEGGGHAGHAGCGWQQADCPGSLWRRSLRKSSLSSSASMCRSIRSTSRPRAMVVGLAPGVADGAGSVVHVGKGVYVDCEVHVGTAVAVLVGTVAVTTMTFSVGVGVSVTTHGVPVG